MRNRRAAFALVAVFACTPGERQVARTALDATQITCVLLTRLTDEAAVAQACGVADALRPALREQLAGKSGAARAGGCRLAGDAGSP